MPSYRCALFCFLPLSDKIARHAPHRRSRSVGTALPGFFAHFPQRVATEARHPTAAMNLQNMIDSAKTRESEVFVKFQQYDIDGSGAIDEVRANETMN